MLQIINECLSLIFVLSAGIYSSRYMNKFYRTLFIQVIIWVVFYLFSYVVTGIQKYQHIEHLNDHWVMNIHIFFETFLLSLAAYFYFSNKKIKNLIMLLFLFFSLFYCFRFVLNGIMEFDGYVVVVESMCVTTMYLLIMYQSFSGNNTNIIESVEFWACIGIVIYFSCCVPYFGLFNYLNIHYLKLSAFLYHVITDVLANVRYFSLALAFWLIRRKQINLPYKSV
ncbi:MAG: hypothetical protein JWP12_3794 [Bacteroidetes bacterium]|nr:hypothetical protein [Bacteroidota bacterium]